MGQAPARASYRKRRGLTRRLTTTSTTKRQAQRKKELIALLITEVRLLTLFADAPPKPFSHLSLADRRKVLERLRGSS